MLIHFLAHSFSSSFIFSTYEKDQNRLTKEIESSIEAVKLVANTPRRMSNHEAENSPRVDITSEDNG